MGIIWKWMIVPLLLIIAGLGWGFARYGYSTSEKKVVEDITDGVRPAARLDQVVPEKIEVATFALG